MLLEVEGVSFSYGEREVLRDVNFALEEGEVLGLVGPNGSGKTTLLRILCGVLRPKSGRVLLCGRDLRRFSRREVAKLVGVVPQNPLLPPAFTGLELVLLGRSPHIGLFGAERPEDVAAALEAMKATGTLEFAGRRIGELSGGERQKLCVARALSQEPKILLLDEPTAHLDINHEIEILELVRRLAEEKKLGVVMAIHDLSLASLYCTRLLLLHRGRIFRSGSSREVIRPEILHEVYGVEVEVIPHPTAGVPVVISPSPDGRHWRS